MAPEKSPAFQFYPKDFLMDGNVQAMSLEERGAYITLLCLCWQELVLPKDPVKLARMVGLSLRAFNRIWPSIQRCFVLTEYGYSHPRLNLERQKQDEYRRRQSDKGRASAANRESTGGQPEGNQTPNRRATGPQPEGNSPISDLRSSDSSQQRFIRAVPKPLDVTDDLAERAARFLERFDELYSQKMLGAKHFRRSPALDHARAIDLCRTWDDDRLDKLAVLFLTTDDDWISRTDRGLSVFVSKATYMDGLLSKWESQQKRSAN